MNDTIFLLSSERSGSNLVTRMFGAHPEICAPGPTHMFRILGGNADRYAATDTDRQEFLTDLRDLFAAKVSRWTLDEIDPDLERIDANSGIGTAILSVYQAEARLSGKGSLFIKENHLYDLLELVKAAAGKPKFLYLVRDPRDMALSWQNASLARGGVVRAARMWAHDQNQFMSALDQLRPDYVTAQATYEDLITNSEGCLRGLSEQLQLEYHPEMLSFHSTPESQKNASASADWSNFGRPILSGNSKKYRDGLTTDQIAYIEHICQAPMTALGYEAETDPERPFGRFETFQDLESALEKDEPWDKEGYASVPEGEKQQRKRWVDVRTRIMSRPIAKPHAQ